MGDEIGEAINFSVDLIVASIVIAMWSTLMYMSNEMGRTSQAEADSIATVQEYRKLNAYDGTTVLPQDIINYIFETRGSPEVWVDTNVSPGVDAFTLKWTPTSASSDYTAEALANKLPTNVSYLSTIVKDANGSVIRLEFRR